MAKISAEAREIVEDKLRGIEHEYHQAKTALEILLEAINDLRDELNDLEIDHKER